MMFIGIIHIKCLLIILFIKIITLLNHFVLVVVLGLGILFLPESISSSLNYSLDSSSPTTSPSHSSNSLSFEDEDDETILEEGGSAENYSSGAAGGYAFTKPFNINGNNDMMGYIGSDGYLYTGGRYWGSSSSTNTTFYKQTNAGTNIVDYDVFPHTAGLIVNSTGQVKRAAATAGSATWSTVSVGGAVTGSSNKAVAVSISDNYQMVLMADGRLYVSDAGATSMTSSGLVSFTTSSTGGIVDISMGQNRQYVLFGNGDLYGGTQGGTSMTRIATGVTMFDFDDRSSYIYIYDGNMIKYASAKGAGTHTWSNLLSSNRTDVVQINSTQDGWGFLTSSGTLYTMEGKPTTQWTSSNHTRTQTGVDYFDAGGSGTWGYLKNGQIYIWQTSSSSYVTSNTTPGLFWGANSSGLTAPDLGGIPSITPPAKQKTAQQSRFSIYILLFIKSRHNSIHFSDSGVIVS